MTNIVIVYLFCDIAVNELLMMLPYRYIVSRCLAYTRDVTCLMNQTRRCIVEVPDEGVVVVLCHHVGLVAAHRGLVKEAQMLCRLLGQKVLLCNRSHRYTPSLL